MADSGAVAWGGGADVDACPLSLYLDITGRIFEGIQVKLLMFKSNSIYYKINPSIHAYSEGCCHWGRYTHIYGVYAS